MKESDRDSTKRFHAVGFNKYDKMNSMVHGKQSEKAKEEFKRKPYGGVSCRTGDQQKESEL